MSLSSESSQTTYTTNGTNTSFPTIWKFFEASTVRCRYTPTGGSETVLTLGVHYTVSGGSGSSGTVTTLSGHTLAAGSLVVERDVPLTQLVDFRAQGPFAPETHTEVADRGMMAIQQIDRRLTVVEAGGGVEGTDLTARLTALENSQAAQDTAISNLGGDVSTLESEIEANQDAIAALNVPAISTATPQPLGTAAAGSTGDAADAGHTHAHGAQALGDGTNHATATTGAAGFMSKEDKQLLAAHDTAINSVIADIGASTTVTTTNASPTAVASWALNEATAEYVEVRAAAVSTGDNGAHGGGFVRRIALKRGKGASSLTAYGTPQSETDMKSGSDALDVGFTFSGVNLITEVYGLASTTINWRVQTRRIVVTM